MTKLSGYSVAITGMGYFAFYKLTMQFGVGPVLTIKHLPGVRAKPEMAALVNQALEYFFNKFRQ